MSTFNDEALGVPPAEQPPDSSDGVFEDDATAVQFIVLSRIYDVLMTQLISDHPEKGEALLGLHLEGGLLMPEPSFNGVFVTSAANDADS